MKFPPCTLCPHTWTASELLLVCLITLCPENWYPLGWRECSLACFCMCLNPSETVYSKGRCGRSYEWQLKNVETQERCEDRQPRTRNGSIFYLLLWSQKRQIPLISSFLFLPLFYPPNLPLQKKVFEVLSLHMWTHRYIHLCKWRVATDLKHFSPLAQNI